MSEQIIQPTQPVQPDQPENNLLLGKYKTVDDLVEGYKNLQSFVNKKSEVEDENKQLKEQINVPESYNKPDVQIENTELDQYKEKAKQLGLTQKQFESFIADQIKEKENYTNQVKSKEDNRKKKYSENGYNQLIQYIKEQHKLNDKTIKNLSDDEIDAFNNHRIKLLSSSIDTVSSPNLEITINDTKEAYLNYFRCKDPFEKQLLFDRYNKLVEAKSKRNT